jgi:hypothetical protein
VHGALFLDVAELFLLALGAAVGREEDSVGERVGGAVDGGEDGAVAEGLEGR